MKVSWKSAAGLAAVAALVLAGCSSPGSVAAPAGPTVWPAVNTSLKGVNLTIWGSSGASTTMKGVVSGFEKLTGADVQVVSIPDPYEQNIQTKVATGNEPDLAFWQPTASMLTAINANTTLQSLAGAPWVGSYTGNLKTLTGLLDNTRYAALITAPAVEGVYYNKELFAKAGITATPKNWDAFIADARQLKAKGITPFFEMGGDQWATQYWIGVQLADAAKAGLWTKVNNNTEKFTDPTILNAITTYQGLIKEGLFNSNIKTATLIDQATAMLTNKAAMVVQVPDFFNTMQATSTTPVLNAKVGFFPISPTGNIGTYIPDQTNALVAFKTGNTTREAASRQFMEYMLGSGYKNFVTSQQIVSIEKNVQTPPSVPDALTSVANALPDSVGSMQALAVANPDLYLNLADMIQGTMTPEQVASTTQAQFAQLAQAEGVKAFH
jgi:raffinose/stachyose/melibiose transport system substrate-binding protein